MKNLTLAVAALMSLPGSAANAAITYSGHVTASNVPPGRSASYTITTDGTLGTLTAANFTGYTLSIDNYGTPFNSSGGGVFVGYGYHTSATATHLSFDFSANDGLGLIFYNGDQFLCLFTGGGSCVGEPTPAASFGSLSYGVVGYAVRPSSIQFIGSSIPEPASWAMLIAGFGLTGAAMRRRKAALTA